MKFSVLTAVAVVATATNLSAQPSLDDYLRLAPSSTETVTATSLLTWAAPGAPGESVWVKSPSGTMTLTTASKLPVVMAASGEKGTFALYYPFVGGTGYRHDVIVD